MYLAIKLIRFSRAWGVTILMKAQDAFHVTKIFSSNQLKCKWNVRIKWTTWLKWKFCANRTVISCQSARIKCNTCPPPIFTPSLPRVWTNALVNTPITECRQLLGSDKSLPWSHDTRVKLRTRMTSLLPLCASLLWFRENCAVPGWVFIYFRLKLSPPNPWEFDWDIYFFVRFPPLVPYSDWTTNYTL